MSDEPGTDLHVLQDYLDDRLSSAQREAFEARLERDAALRLELELAQEARAALVDVGPELSHGFYTRARARFEESSRSERRWSFRLLSWETAGVAAAAALATALFVPRLTQEGLPTDLGAVGQVEQQAVASDVATEPDSSFAPAPADERSSRAKEGLEEAAPLQKNRVEKPAAAKPKRENKDSEMLDAPEPVVREPERFAETKIERQEPSIPPGKKGPATGRRARVDRDDDAFRVAAQTEEAENAPRIEVVSEGLQQTGSGDAEVYAEHGKRAAAAFDRTQPVVAELQAGLVKRNELRSVEQTEEWVALLAGPHAESIELLGAPAADRRLVLIGARKGLACDTLTVTSDDHTYRIEAVHLPTEREATDGCALVLPRDGRSVTIANPQ